MDAIWHRITPNPRLDPMQQARGHHAAFMGELFVGGVLVDVDPVTEESTWEGGRKVATIFRRTEGLAIGECIRLSRFVPAVRP